MSSEENEPRETIAKALEALANDVREGAALREETVTGRIWPGRGVVVTKHRRREWNFAIGNRNATLVVEEPDS